LERWFGKDLAGKNAAWLKFFSLIASTSAIGAISFAATHFRNFSVASLPHAIPTFPTRLVSKRKQFFYDHKDWLSIPT
jgi:hypothetical protein